MKDETFYIVRGTVRMTADGDTTTMKAGDVFKMKPGVDHTFADPRIGNQGII